MYPEYDDFFLAEKIVFLYIKKGIRAGHALQVEGNGTAEDLFWTTEEEFHEYDAITFVCDGDSTN